MESILTQVDVLIKTYLGPQWDLSMVISKALGYGIVVFSMILKLPQIQKLVSSRDATGVSLLSVVLETMVFTISVLSGVLLKYPFSTYGESVFILAQNIIIVYLVFLYKNKIGAMFWAGVVTYLAVVYGVVQVANRELLLILTSANIGVAIFSKIPQLFMNFREKSVGQLSFVTTLLNFIGSLVRVFTTLKEIPDKIVLLSYSVGAGLNLLMLIQFILYWNNKTPTRKVVQPGKKKQQ
ncbi:transmembrane protein [Heterostelium album PN500]|uniref:Mannose-P-dolichol utilization defect 1 protein homolog n=1 Tax=Heterostelium pallidum (strain ATCC 26659 / Pp 5 / PN500) TaxID=670386 RepID=D3AY63_HETP5|nr:transmembrane protein [Heterostelium album PN500]EFA85890.1 transmembrane protein [Heterostelium album PN500]|eukprot:XP_020437996.1 transmembrane protein [Heterostelium album PN500]